MAIVLLVVVVVTDVSYAMEQGLAGWTLLAKVATVGAIVGLLHHALRGPVADDEAGRGPPRT